MIDPEIRDIFVSLRKARWDVAHRAYGSSHKTFIGLLVQWWIDLSLDSHSVIDEPPSFEKNLGRADLIFCRREEPFALVEVEGTAPLAKLQTMQKYFTSAKPELKSLSLGILLCYAYEHFGRAPNKQYRKAEQPAVLDAIRQLTAALPQKALIMIALEKEYTHFAAGIRSVSSYTFGTTSAVTGVLFAQGQEIDRMTYFDHAIR
jgi:hypothetical protein